MPKALEKVSTQRLSKRELRAEAEALIAESQIEAKKLAKAKRAESKAHRERVVRMTSGNLHGQPKTRLEESMQALSISRPVHPSQQMLRAKQQYLGIGQRIRQTQEELKTLGFTRTPHVSKPGSKTVTIVKKASVQKIGQPGVKDADTGPYNPELAPYFRTVTPTFFTRLHNAIKVGYTNPSSDKGQQSWAEREQAQKLVQTTVIDMAASEVNQNGDLPGHGDGEAKKSRSGQTLKINQNVNFDQARKSLSLAHAPTFPAIDLTGPKTSKTKTKTPAAPGTDTKAWIQTNFRSGRSCCSGNKNSNPENKRRIRFSDEPETEMDVGGQAKVQIPTAAPLPKSRYMKPLVPVIGTTQNVAVGVGGGAKANKPAVKL